MNILGSISWVDFLTSLFILLTIYNVIVFIYFLANKTADNQSILPENKYSESENEQLSFIDNSEDSFEEETTIINADEPYNANIETEDDYQYTEVDNPPLPITPEEQNIIDQRFLEEETIVDENTEGYSEEGVVIVGPFPYTEEEMLKLDLAELIRSGVKDDESKEYLYAQIRAVQD